MDMICNLTHEIKEIRKEQNKSKEEVIKLNKEIKELKKENSEIRKENMELKEQIQKDNARIEKLEKEKREKNIVIQGLDIKKNETENLKNRLEHFIKDELNVVVSVQAASRLGKKTCLVELADKQDKFKIMRNKKILKERPGDKVYIDNDFTPKEREIENQIRMVAKEERTKGKKVISGYQKLFIDGIEFRWNMDKEKLERVVPDMNDTV